MRLISCLLFSFVFSTQAYSQATNFNKHWLAGGGGVSMIDFRTGVAITDTFRNNNLVQQNIRIDKGHSNICDNAGEIILMCNGYTLFDSAGVVVMGGDTLVDNALYVGEIGYSIFSQTSIILPMDSGIYYLIIPNATDNVYTNWYSNPLGYNIYFDQLLLYKIDIDGNNGLPKVIDRVVLMDSVKMMRTMMMACKHANGKDWWLVKQMKDTSINMSINNYPVSKNKIGKILLSDTGFSVPNYQEFPGTYMTQIDQIGQAMFNCDGSKFVVSARGLEKIFLADFDRNSGAFTNPEFIDVPYPAINTSTYLDSIIQGVCFSPNSQFVYIAKAYNILQYDLLEPDTSKKWYHVAGVDTPNGWFANYANIYPGPDNKLYIGNQSIQSQTMSYIDSPSIKGVGCAWRPRGLQFRQTPYYVTSGPPCMPYYDMDLVPCDTSVSTGGGEPDGVAQWTMDNGKLKIYPNPTSNFIIVEIEGSYNSYRYHLLSLLGRSLQSGVLGRQLDVSSLPPGIYIFRISNEQGSVSRKVVIE